MAITTERLPGARVALQIEVDPELVERHMERAVTRISKQVRIPGFRPGKAPRKTIERTIGSAAILQEALEELVPAVYNEALEESQIEAIDQPEIELQSTEPLVVRAIVPVRPEVDLGDYQSLRAPKPEVAVTEEQVEDTLLALRRQFAVLEPVDRPIEWDDHVRADVKVTIEDHPDVHDDKDAEFALRRDGTVSLPGFAERLIGLEVGTHTFEYTLPDDMMSEELNGKKASYEVVIHEVKREILPDLDDEFVKSLDEDSIETVDALRERVRNDLQTQSQRNADEGYHNEILDLLMTSAKLDYPEVLVTREVERVIDRESNHASHTPEGLANWLKAIGKTEEEVREMYRDQADLSVRRGLVLGELIDAEQIKVTDEQIEAELDSLVGQVTGPNEASRGAIRGIFDTPDGRNSIRNQLMTRFAIERLAEIAAQPEDEEDAPRRSSRRRRGASAESEETPAASDAGGAEDAESGD